MPNKGEDDREVRSAVAEDKPTFYQNHSTNLFQFVNTKIILKTEEGAVSIGEKKKKGGGLDFFLRYIG